MKLSLTISMGVTQSREIAKNMQVAKGKAEKVVENMRVRVDVILITWGRKELIIALSCSSS